MARAAVSPATTLVPPNRLAELLTSTRLAAGIDIREIEERAAGRFSVGELQLIETGGLTLTDEDLRAIAVLYGVDLSGIAPSRAVLEIDRAEGRLVVADSQQRFLPGDDDRQIMLRYLALVYRLRDQTPGLLLPARVGDLDILAQVFGTDPDRVSHELQRLMVGSSKEIRSLHRSHRRRVAIPAIGILVALTAAGGLLLTSRSPDAEAHGSPRPAAVTTPHVSIGRPLVVIHDATPAGRGLTIGQPLVVSRDDTPSDARANIGDAVVIRADDPRS